MNKAQLVSKILILSGIWFLTGCTSNELKVDGITPGVPVERVYFGEYGEVEMAIRASMKKYPVKEDNLDAGIFETEYIRGDKMYRAPGSHDRSESGVRYRIQIHTIKGKVEGKAATQLIIKKVVEKTRDFFAETEPLASDGLEENIIFYRVQRELTIARAVKRASEAPQPVAK